MNENYYTSNENEMEISLVDLLFYLLKQWRTLAVAIIIGALIGSGIYMLKKPAAASIPTDENPEITFEDYEVDPEVRANMELAFEFRQLYYEQLEYNQNSLMMQMDSSKVYLGKVSYYLEAGKDTLLISEQYVNLFNDDSLMEELKEDSGIDCQPQYLRELLKCDVSSEVDPVVNIGNSQEETGLIDYTSKRAVITYTVSFMDKEICEDMLQIIKNKVESLQPEYQEAYSSYTLRNITDTVYLTTNYDYLSQQKANVDALNSYLSGTRSIESGFSEDDLSYYKAIYLNRAIEKEDMEDEEAMQPPIQQESTWKNLVKWLVVGVFLMCCIWGVYYVLKYFMDKHIKRADELKDVYGLNLIGLIEKKSVSRNGIDRWLEGLYRKNYVHGDTEEYILSSIDSLNKKNILLCGNMENEEIKKYADSLCKKSDKLHGAEFVYQDSEALTKAKEMDGILLLVQIRGTQYSEIKRELEVCQIQNIAVLGAIAIG